MTPTDLAAALIADVPRFALIDGPYGPFMGRATSGEYLHVSDVSSALSRALDPAIAERAAEVLEGLYVSDPVCEEHFFANEAADLITTLLAQNAALRAERDELSSKLEVERALTDAVHRWAKAAEAERDALRGALTNLPAVYAHKINTGVREVYDPLQRFYTMESVLTALKGASHD